MTRTRLCLVGAGAAAAGLAYGLRDSPVDITVFEKSRGVGGRAATRRKDGTRYDHGANYVTDADTQTTELLQSLGEDGLVTIDEPVWTFDKSGSIESGDPERQHRKWTWEAGITQLAKRLFAETDAEIEFETRVETLRERDGEWTLTDTDGVTHGPFDAVVLTPPAPQTAELVSATEAATLEGDTGHGDGGSDGEAAQNTLTTLESAIRDVPYRTVRTVVLSYPFELEAPWYALVNTDREHAIGWLAREECKPGHVPAGESLLIVQMSPDWSTAQYDAPLEVAADEVAGMVATLLEDDRLADPAWVDDQGWRYALPEAGLGDGEEGGEDDEGDDGDEASDSEGGIADALESAREVGLFFAGDWVVGERRVHAALWNGIKTADVFR